MDFLGVGPLEIIFILIIALIVMGPKDMAKTGRTVGVFLRKIVMSPTWRAVQQTSKEIRYLPNKLMREAGLEEQAEELKKLSKEVNELSNFKNSFDTDLRKASSEINKGLSAWTTPPDIGSIQPPSSKPEQSTQTAPPAEPASPATSPGIPSTSHPEPPPDHGGDNPE